MKSGYSFHGPMCQRLKLHDRSHVAVLLRDFNTTQCSSFQHDPLHSAEHVTVANEGAPRHPAAGPINDSFPPSPPATTTRFSQPPCTESAGLEQPARRGPLRRTLSPRCHGHPPQARGGCCPGRSSAAASSCSGVGGTVQGTGPPAAEPGRSRCVDGALPRSLLVPRARALPAGLRSTEIHPHLRRPEPCRLLCRARVDTRCRPLPPTPPDVRLRHQQAGLAHGRNPSVSAQVHFRTGVCVMCMWSLILTVSVANAIAVGFN
jgi:hypothetical protein